jgi:PTS system nitrogen regulatory IIA component
MLIGGGETAESADGRGRDALIDPRLVFSGLAGSTREEVLRELAERLAFVGAIRDPAVLLDRLLERERLGSTGLGGGIAIPHCKLPGLPGVMVAMATTERPVDFGAGDGVHVSVVFLAASPPQAAAAHLQALARISRLLRVPGVADRLRQAGSDDRLRDVLADAESSLGMAP